MIIRTATFNNQEKLFQMKLNDLEKELSKLKREMKETKLENQ